MEESCETCRFFRGRYWEGYCHRLPPRHFEASYIGTPTPIGQGSWPVVHQDNWCGEYLPVAPRTAPPDGTPDDAIPPRKGERA